MPAIAASVDVVVAVACAISLSIGGSAFTGNDRRFVPSGRRGVGGAHWLLSFKFVSVLSGDLCYVSRLSLADMNIVP